MSFLEPRNREGTAVRPGAEEGKKVPVGYKFVDRITGEAVKLSRVDEEIAQFEGVGYDADAQTHRFLDPIAFFGVAVLWVSGGTVITKEGFEAFVAKSGGEFDQQFLATAREFLLDRYEFHAWRE